MPRKSAALKKPQNERQEQANTPKRGNAAPRRVAPVTIRKETDARAQQIGQDHVVTMDPAGPAELKRPGAEIETVVGTNKQKLEYERFMAEPVTVQIHETAEEQADPRFDIMVNGRKKTFVRGQEYTIPRYFVEGLARAKPVGFTNQEYIKEDGSRSVRWPTKTGLRYGFSVLNDPSGTKGAVWLKQVLRQP